MPIYTWRTSSLARDIYLFGNRTFASIDQNYVIPVKQYAATGLINGTPYPAGFTGYTQAEIDNALAKGWITQQEYADTMAYKNPA